MKLVKIWVLSLILSALPGMAFAKKKIEIVELSNSQLINRESPSSTLVLTARKIEGEKLSKKLKNRLTKEGLKVKVNLPKQDGVKLKAFPSKVKLAFNPETETFSTADVLVFPVEID